MASANIDAMVREAVRVLREGKRDDAQRLLLHATERDPYNEEAWLWLANVVDTFEERRTCLENVLVINESNQRAREELARLTTNPTSAAPSPFEQAVASAPPPPSAAAPAAPAAPATPAPPEPSRFGDNVSSSPSVWRDVQEPSSQDYDDWIAGLNLGSDVSAGPAAPSRPSNVAPPAPEPAPPPTPAPAAAPADPFEGVFSNVDFLRQDAPPPPPAPSPPSAPAFAMDDGRALDFDALVSAPPPPPARNSPLSEVLGRPSDDDVPGNDFDLFDAPLDDEDIVGAAIGAPNKALAQRKGGARFDDDDDVLDAELLDDLEDDGDFFRLIPSEVRPTRLPGTDERAPAALTGLVWLLVVLNLVAGVVLALNVWA